MVAQSGKMDGFDCSSGASNYICFVAAGEAAMTERTHLATSSAPIVLREVCVEAEKGKGCYKPAGFWYEVDGDWRRWCEAEQYDCGLFLHAVELNDCNVLRINTLGKLDDFHRGYKAKRDLFPSYSRLEIDWPRVAERYDGIEIAPYQWKRRLDNGFMWYYGWDCASGVIWRPKNATVAYLGKYELATSTTDGGVAGPDRASPCKTNCR